MTGRVAHTRFVRWLDERVTAEGRGDHAEALDVDPAGVFWLGRLAPENAAIARPGRERRMGHPLSSDPGTAAHLDPGHSPSGSPPAVGTRSPTAKVRSPRTSGLRPR